MILNNAYNEYGVTAVAYVVRYECVCSDIYVPT